MALNLKLFKQNIKTTSKPNIYTYYVYVYVNCVTNNFVLTKVFNVRKVDSTELSLCLFRCFANTPNPPCDTPCLAIVSDLCMRIVINMTTSTALTKLIV